MSTEQRVAHLEGLMAQLEQGIQTANNARTHAEAAALKAEQQAEAILAPRGDQTEAKKRDAKRALAWVPRFDQRQPWSAFEAEFTIWHSVNSISDVGDDFGKLALMAAMRGQAAQSVKPYSYGTPTWNGNVTYAAYYSRIREVFLPPQESELARVEFRSRKQNRAEDISSYLSSKIARWQQAFGDTERAYSTLFNETIRGVWSDVVKRELHRANPNNEQELRTQLLRIVATERESYKQGYGEATSLDGLAAVSQTAKSYRGTDDDQMEWEDSMNAMKRFSGNCNTCKKPGHKSAECRDGRSKGNAGSGNDRGRNKTDAAKTCFYCKKLGHISPDCYKKARDEKRKGEKDPKAGTKKRYGKIKAITGDTDSAEDEENPDFLDGTGGSLEEN